MFPIIKNLKMIGWCYDSFWFHGSFPVIFIFLKPCSEGHLRGVPHLYLGLGDVYICIFEYICIYGAKPFFLGTGHQLMTRSWMVCFHISFIKNLMDMYKNFLPLMVTYHPMIYLFEDEGLFPLIIKKLL